MQYVVDGNEVGGGARPEPPRRPPPVVHPPEVPTAMIPSHRPQPTEDTTTLGVPDYLVPLRTWVRAEKTVYNVGNEIRLTCQVEGYPEPRVTWSLNQQPIRSGSELSHGQSEVLIESATETDGGTYRCEAENEYGSAFSDLTITIESQGPYLHPNCTDNTFFANCALIVKASFCTNKYYARFCCKSCTIAGQLPPYGPHLQEYRTAYFRHPGTETVTPTL